MYTVYGLVDPRNEQLKYVGVTKKKLKDRLSLHLADARNATKNSLRLVWLRDLLNQESKPEIFDLENVPEEDRFVSERFWIAYFRFVGADLVNSGDSGAGVRGFRHNAESRARMSKSQRNITPEQRKHKSDAHKGKKRSEEFKRKISEANRKRRLSPETRAKISASVSKSLIGNTRSLGFKHSEATREKIKQVRLKIKAEKESKNADNH